MESEDGDIFEVADPRSEFEQTIISEMQIAAFAGQNITDKDREILKLRMDGHTEQEIADMVATKPQVRYTSGLQKSQVPMRIL